ncbi:hypothetical protein [Terasakiella sp. SH-1]|uniref:hypothetical protein n=1 Tax=Terasakiella sp. SH-1 TaxID=2560057 RepID=UPI00107446EC|nr:hypothetical protein [Terasakiella sp. SH-1]
MADEPTDDEVRAYAEKLRDRGRNSTMEQLIETCLAYNEESRRSDRLHAARMQKCKERLYASIEYAYHELHRKPLDKVEMHMYRQWLIEKQGKS